jgi:hypothetical protein
MRKYIYTVRKNKNFFENDLQVDTFLEVTDLEPNRINSSIQGINLRLRFNPECYQHILLVKGEDLELDAVSLENFINAIEDKETFLKESILL